MTKPLTAALLLALAQSAGAVSNTFTYQGSLVDAGVPANGTYDLRFELEDLGAPAVVRDDVPVSGGVFTVELDFGAAITSGNFNLVVGVRPGNSNGAYTTLSPSTPIHPTPQAQIAGLATEAVTVSPNAVGSGGIADGSIGAVDINTAQVQSRVSGTCADGNAIRSIGADGAVVCQAAGSVTSVATGAGLSGGPITSAGTIAIANDGVNAAMIANGAVGGTEIVPAEVQARVNGSCAPGSSIRAVAEDGSVSCEASAVGSDWSLTGNSGTNAASNFIGTLDAQPFVVRTRNAQALRLEPSSLLWTGGLPNTANVIAGSNSNSVMAGSRGAAVLGGGAASGSEGVPFVGQPNSATDHYTLVGGGYDNRAGNNNANLDDAMFATALGGNTNRAAGKESVVLGGRVNSALSQNDIVLGGSNNTAQAGTGSILGGFNNAVTGPNAVVVGGAGNCAGGASSFAAGSNAQVRPQVGGDAGNCSSVADSGDADGDEGAFVWADRSSATAVTSSGPNQFLVRADGGFLLNANTLPGFGDDLLLAARKVSGDADVDLRMLTRTGRGMLMYVKDSNGSLNFGFSSLLAGADRITVGGGSGGNATLSNGGTWTNASSREFKLGFTQVNVREVLARVVDLPITRWNYKGSAEGTHMGPMAEDFKAAFDLAGTGKSIATVDADGVALAAIQGLNQKLEAENAELRRRLDAIEAKINAR